MSEKVRNVLAVLMGIFMVVGIILGIIAHDEKLYVPFALLAFILAGIVKFTRGKESHDNKITRKRSRMTARKATIWTFVLFCLFIIMGYATNFNDIIVLPIIGVDCVCAIMIYVLGAKEEKDAFETIILDMECTEKVMSVHNEVVSDQEIISKIEKFIAMKKGNNNLEKRDKDGKTLLINAACYARTEVIKYLLNRGADIYARDDVHFTALHTGVMSKDIETVKVLLNAGAEVNAKDSLGGSPIMLADFTTDLEVFRILMAYGANPEQKNKYGVSAMDIFAQSPEIIEVLSQR